MAPTYRNAPAPNDYTHKCHYTRHVYACAHWEWAKHPRIAHMGPCTSKNMGSRCGNIAADPREKRIERPCNKCQPAVVEKAVRFEDAPEVVREVEEKEVEFEKVVKEERGPEVKLSKTDKRKLRKVQKEAEKAGEMALATASTLEQHREPENEPERLSSGGSWVNVSPPGPTSPRSSIGSWVQVGDELAWDFNGRDPRGETPDPKGWCQVN